MIKRLVSILLLLAVLTTACSCEYFNRNKHEIEDPDVEEGEGQNDAEEEEPIVYVYSVLSKSIHLKDCYHVKEIKEDYKKETTGDVSALTEKGYTLCKDCFPPAIEEEPEVPNDPGVSKEDATFLLNKSSHKIHMLDCYHIGEMVEENIEYTDLSLEELLEAENIPCATCLPEQWEIYKEQHPELDSD